MKSALTWLPEESQLLTARHAARVDPAPLEGHVHRDVLFHEFQPLVRRLVRQYRSSPEVHEDLCNEMYCRFCALLDAYDPSRGIPLRHYLVRQLSASAYTFARRHWRRQRREISLEGNAGVAEAAHSEDPTPKWDHALAADRLRRTLAEAIAQLPLRQRQVVIARYYESRSHDEIAAALGIRVATARSLLRHGLNSLRRWVEAHHPEL